jgi:hypothetical protein
MNKFSADFGATPQQIEFQQNMEEVQTTAKRMMFFGLLLAFSTLALVLKNRG